MGKGPMRRALSILIIIIILMMTITVNAEIEDKDYLGTWYFNSLYVQGKELTQEAMGYEVSIDIKEDNTAIITYKDEEETGKHELKWSMKKNHLYLKEGDEVIRTLTIKPEEQQLWQEEEEVAYIVYGRIKPVKAYEPQPVAGKEEEYYGIWQAAYIITENRMIPATLLRTKITAEISNKKIIIDDEKGPTGTTYKYEDSITTNDGTKLEGVLLVESDEDKFYVSKNDMGGISLIYPSTEEEKEMTVSFIKLDEQSTEQVNPSKDVCDKKRKEGFFK